MAQCLFAADGRYVGVLNVSTRRPRRTSEPARAVVRVTLLTEAPRRGRRLPACPPPGRAATEARRPGGLSPRGLQVPAEPAADRTDREIAERLHITPRTVGTHIGHTLAELDLPDRAAAAARAAAWGIEPLEP
ncbi:LuxR C-terminal-related transcriptional regulator [Streptomyces sp. NPDC096048]|uniref:LuxR C-terminal-related transcriptional regulator n=1 Tax=Streptomyces sp. NPDC096048 TaxID=3366072 RepID=UPI00381DC2E7